MCIDKLKETILYKEMLRNRKRILIIPPKNVHCFGYFITVLLKQQQQKKKKNQKIKAKIPTGVILFYKHCESMSITTAV